MTKSLCCLARIGRPWVTLAGLFMTLCVVPRMAPAAALNRAEQTIANFSFASQLGSGIYSINGRTVQIYRLPFSWEYSKASADQTGVSLLMPITLGFYDFNIEDVLHTKLPRSIDTLSFVPGVRVSRVYFKDWLFNGFMQAGVGKERTSTADSIIYASGIGADHDFNVGSFRMHYDAQLLYAAALFKDRSNDAMVRLSNGIEARKGLRMSIRDVALDYGAYAMNEWYLRRPAPPLESVGAPITPVQWEFGVTFGSEKPVYLWKVPLPRIGFGYRFGDSLSVFRIVFGAPF